MASWLQEAVAPEPASAWLQGLPLLLRIVLMLGAAAALHLLLRAIRGLLQSLRSPKGLTREQARESFGRRYPKLATVSSLLSSALAFVVYFLAFGLVLRELGVDPTAYFATATVVGLAVGFGSQGLVQDVVIGLTLLFSDAFDIGDTIEVAGQIGRVERMGLRFTVLTNFLGQTVYVPNRNIAQVGRYRGGVIRVYVDAQVPQGVSDEEMTGLLERLGAGFRAQHRSIVLSDAEVQGIREAEPGGWRYARMLFRMWPGQGGLVDTGFRPRLLAALKQIDPSYSDWMIVVTYRVLREDSPPQVSGRRKSWR